VLHFARQEGKGKEGAGIPGSVVVGFVVVVAGRGPEEEEDLGQLGVGRRRSS